MAARAWAAGLVPALVLPGLLHRLPVFEMLSEEEQAAYRCGFVFRDVIAGVLILLTGLFSCYWCEVREGGRCGRES